MDSIHSHIEFRQVNSLIRDTSTLSDVIPFHRPGLKQVNEIHRLLTTYPHSRACDFSIGGIFMWLDYFNYKTAVINDTLFVTGGAEDNTHRQAFSLPMGKMNLKDSIEILKRHCKVTGSELLLSAVPDDAIEKLREISECKVQKLEGWSDYVYNIDDLADLKGKKYNKKRNHVNSFRTAFPNYSFQPITRDLVKPVLEFYNTQLPGEEVGAMKYYDAYQVINILENLDNYPMWEGYALAISCEGVVAFTVGEVMGDTLITHVEKMRHDVNGAGECVNKLFAEQMRDKYPQLRYNNREEDLNEPGLRRAKLSYHPAMMIDKYNVEVNV